MHKFKFLNKDNKFILLFSYVKIKKPIINTREFAPGFVNYKKGALDSQPQVIKFTSCLSMIGGSPASSTTKTGCHDITEILLKVALNTKNQSINPSQPVFALTP